MPTFSLRGEPNFTNSMHNTNLLLSRNIHHVQSQQLAGNFWKSYIQMNLHFFTCSARIVLAVDLLIQYSDPVNKPRPLSTINSGCTTTRLQSAHSPQASQKTISSEAIVTTPPEVVRTLASSTVLVKASSLVNLDFGAIVVS